MKKTAAGGDGKQDAGDDQFASPTAVVHVVLTVGNGLHSPVLINGNFPVVDGVVTSFDSIAAVTLAAYGLSSLEAVCQVTGTCKLLLRAFFHTKDFHTKDSTEEDSAAVVASAALPARDASGIKSSFDDRAVLPR